MKKILLLISIALLANSCKNTWNEEDKAAFYEACTEEGQKTGESPEQAKTHCDCVFAKMQKKYPNEEDALEHIDQLAKDTDLIKCKEEVKQK